MRRAFTNDLARRQPCQRRNAPATGIKIVIAEDDADQRRILGVSLTHAGFLPVALARARAKSTECAGRSALILLDIAMPGLDGYSVCRLLSPIG